jgi:hypothetical protein
VLCASPVDKLVATCYGGQSKGGTNLWKIGGITFFAKKGEAPSSSKEIVVHAESAQKIELVPNDVKLEEVNNYLSLSRRTMCLLKAKKLEGLVNGESAEPKDKSSAEWKDWDATNSMVTALMLSSMTPAIAEYY